MRTVATLASWEDTVVSWSVFSRCCNKMVFSFWGSMWCVQLPGLSLWEPKDEQHAAPSVLVVEVTHEQEWKVVQPDARYLHQPLLWIWAHCTGHFSWKRSCWCTYWVNIVLEVDCDICVAHLFLLHLKVCTHRRAQNILLLEVELQS